MAEQAHFSGPEIVTFELDHQFHISGEAWGDKNQPPVILLHGVGQTRHSWGDTARLIAQAGWYALALDARGHGESDWAPDGHYKIEYNAKDLIQIAQTFKQKPAVVGASMGGLTALIAENISPRPICAALVLVDIVPRPDPKGIARIFQFMSAYTGGFDSFEAAVKAVSQYLPHRSPDEIAARLGHNLRQREDKRYYWHWDPKILNNFTARASAGEAEQSAQKLLKAAQTLSMPTLAVRGGLSDIVTDEAVQELKEAAPQIEHVDVSDAHHMVAGDSNQVFSEEVIKFLKRVYPV